MKTNVSVSADSQGDQNICFQFRLIPRQAAKSRSPSKLGSRKAGKRRLLLHGIGIVISRDHPCSMSHLSLHMKISFQVTKQDWGVGWTEEKVTENILHLSNLRGKGNAAAAKVFKVCCTHYFNNPCNNFVSYFSIIIIPI